MISQNIKDLIERYRSFLSSGKEDITMPKIHVDEIASKIAAVYERIRAIIDYQEEHLLRKRVINRILVRRFLLKNISPNIGEPLIKEIIRSGYLPNDTVPETKISEIQKIIDNLSLLLTHLKELKDPREEQIAEWLTDIATNSVEENLFPPTNENIIADTMFWAIKERLSISGGQLTEEEINLQLFIAIQRTLLKTDDDQLNYRLLKFIYPEWNTMGHGALIKIVNELPDIKTKINNHLKNPIRKVFYQLCNKYNTVFYLIRDVMEKSKSAQELEEIFSDTKKLESGIREAYDKRFARERGRLHRLAFFSVISIFLSKIVVALGIEVPIDLYITKDYSFLNTIINITAPPLLMLMILSSIKMPSDKNIGLILTEVNNIVYSDKKKAYLVNLPKKKKLITNIIIHLSYAAVFFFSLNAMLELLSYIRFSVANIIVFIFFISLVAATGTKINHRSKEISLEEKRPTLRSFIVDLFGLPFINIGKWGLTALSKLNILVVVFNLIIDLPLQLFIEFLENFRGFIKSKKEDIH